MTRPSHVAAGAAVALAARAALRRARPSLDLRDRVVLITGGSRGLGFALAQEFGRAGARVGICARGEQALERARDRLAGDGIAVHAWRCDVSDRAQVDGWVAAARTELGTVDVLVNNAGVITVGPVPSLELSDFEEAMAIQFWGTLYPTLAVLPAMRARRAGTIVNVTSIGGKVSVPHLVSYNPSKFAAVGLSQGLRVELARDGIRVVTVVPGLMRTGGYGSAFYKGRRRLEYTLFSPLAASPLNTISARRAARRIVAAARRGEAEVTLTLHAKALARLNGLAPGLTSELLRAANRLLPPAPPDGGRERERGDAIGSPLDDSPLMALGRRAKRDYNQDAGV